ncbi:succinate dehydrogenase cytochrome b560 subunit, mitochondrial-like [Daphnia pulicaria]|uniref:succinate dehydrogenase cytochrome b560 subunit, mitochondrial-like n=1 Tax=Daphnia pulicaria TaxID=35523 RepID=UPI001EEBC41C|nr:succinate dehydrogenase cytochrome b560 subunit, mitochondrial-like [Daphnia pulicaria]
MLFLRYLKLSPLVYKSINACSPSILVRRQQKFLFSNKASNFPNVAEQPELKVGEDFENKNRRLKRPLSAHLSIHKLQNNMILSMTHRFTGVILCGIPFGLATVGILLPESYPYYLEILESMNLNRFMITTGKFLVVLPFSFHYLNGIRHLIWDLGYWLTIKEVDRSGYVVLLLAVVLSFHLLLL